MKANSLARNPEYVDRKITVVESRFIDLCRRIKFGRISKVEVAHGQPVVVDEVIKDHRLDLTELDDTRTVKSDN